MIVARPQSTRESCLLSGYEFSSLIITDLDKQTIKTIPSPENGWTYDLLEQFDYESLCEYGWIAYLQDKTHWIGSSEV